MICCVPSLICLFDPVISFCTSADIPSKNQDKSYKRRKGREKEERKEARIFSSSKEAVP